MLQSYAGEPSLPLLDSLAASVVSVKWPAPPTFLTSNGFPAAQVQFNQRWMQLVPTGTPIWRAWRGSAYASVARGAWDSALVMMDRYAAGSPDDAAALDIYRLAVIGAWLGGLDTLRAAERRPAAAKYVARLSPDSASGKEARATLAWSDGMLAVLRRDRKLLSTAREANRQSGASGAANTGRLLSAFEAQLREETRTAADSFAMLDIPDTTSALAEVDSYTRSVAHMNAAQLMLALGDTSRAVRLLYWHEAHGVDKDAFPLFEALAYDQLARIEEAQGKDDLARDHYQQFLRRYDMPPPAHQYMVDNAKAALRRLSGQNDAPATR